MNSRREVGHQKSPMRPEKFRDRLGLPEDKKTELQWKYTDLCVREQSREPIKLTSIKPQQPGYALAANSLHIGENVAIELLVILHRVLQGDETLRPAWWKTDAGRVEGLVEIFSVYYCFI